ncbi:MAG: DUF4493 domain-containing protein [Rikenellaceae bacterium]|nr:DUF4493 domain-containing protein [Rikenellaceae bacterium]
MKKSLYTLILLAGGIVAASCASNTSRTGKDMGFSLKSRPDMQGLSVSNHGTTNDEASVNEHRDAIAAMAVIDNFKITLIDNETEAVTHQWERFSDVPPVAEIEKGSYTLIAESRDIKVAGFDSPHFKGEDRIGIMPGKLTEINLSCKLQNAATYVEFDPSFAGQLEGGTVTIAKTDAGNKNSELVFTPDGKDKYGFFSVGTGGLRVTAKGVSKKSGTVLTKTVMIDQISANELHCFRISAIGTGQAELGIVFDGTATDKNHDVAIPEEGGDDGDGSDFGDIDDPWADPDTPVQGGTPAIKGKGFDIANPLTFTAAEAASAEVIVNFTAPAGIANLIVEIDSPLLTEELLGGFGLPVSFDIANLTPELKEVFVGLGLIGNDPIAGAKEASFSVGTFMSLLEEGTHKFHIALTDANGVEEKATLTIVRTN